MTIIYLILFGWLMPNALLGAFLIDHYQHEQKTKRA